MEYVPKHTQKTIFLMVKSWWFVMAFVIYLWLICDGVRIFCDGSIVFFFSRVASLFLYKYI